ncbi:DUF1835 domain-containing protein [Solemya velum gill symbiont]|uniref:DUF1835 domain-containing protein n=1 Tax=Solemya velum gill symbiont TaxID=2340 RepID=UPI0009980EF0|nr:DUF1835 domain-containing protein [Solemya velum gill symbiont]
MILNFAALRAGFTSTPPLLSYRFDKGDPRRLQALTLEQQKERAKARLQEWNSSVESEQPLREFDEAQQVIANEYGFDDWEQLTSHIGKSEIASKAMQAANPDALDGNERVLHIRCGTDIQNTLAVAGFNGDYLPFYDPYVHGPVPQTDLLDEFIQVRANYISSGIHPDCELVLNDLRQQYSSLELSHNHDAVYLWFEHDSFDQLILARLLDFFSEVSRRPASLKLISVDHYPGVEIFNGIGQLPPQALRVLWTEFSDVTPEQLVLGKRAWAAVRSSCPDALRVLIASGTTPLPTMAIALDRHLRQLPSKHNGLNLSENLTLRILDEKGSMNAACLFGWYTNHYEPLTFMGDTGYWQLLEELANGDRPAVTMDREGEQPNQWQVTLSDTGRQLLADEVDWVELNGIDRWVGGIHLDSQKGQVPRWSE